MSSQLTITTQLTGDHWTITAEVVPGGILPSDIFIYTNTGTTDLGDYFGVCSLNELTRLQTWTGVALPVFGNRYVKYSQAKIVLALEVDPNTVVSHLVASATALSAAIQANGTTTKTVIIP